MVFRHSIAACILLALITLPAAAVAQETREQVIAQQQAAKAKDLRPYTPSRGEQLLLQMYDTFVLDPNGFYPYFGSVYSGGGFTLGAGYRHYISDRIAINTAGLYSLKNYKWIEFSVQRTGSRRRGLSYGVRTGWRDAPQVAYYGLGIDSPENRTNFHLKQGYVGGDISVRPLTWTVLGGALTYEDFNLSEGAGNFPSIEQVFTPATAPGLGVNPTYVHSMGLAGIDWRPAADYARTGGLYQVSYHQYDDRDNVFSFDRVDTEVVQHIPILRENWVISLHGLMQTTLNDNDLVPYFLMPSLGSGSTLRGYQSWRFRDRHSLLMSGEWRWIPSKLALDAAIFYDAGMVSPTRDGLGLSNLKKNVGFGIRFHSLVATPLRIEVAKGDEGINVVFSGSSAF